MDRQHAPTERGDLVRDRRQARVVDVGQHDVGAGARHGQRRAAPDAARAAGDDRHFAGELHRSAGMTSLAISSSAATSA